MIKLHQNVDHSTSLCSVFFDQAPDPMFILDFEGSFIEINQAAYHQIGYSFDELLKMKIKDIEAVADMSLISTRLAKISKEKKNKFETTLLHKSGKHIPVEINVRLIEVEGKAYLLCICRDVTERKSYENALAESAMRCKRFADELPLGIVITQQGLIKYVNSATAEMSGYTKEELLNQPFLTFVYPSSRACVADYHQRRMNGESAPTPYIAKFIHKNSEIKQWQIDASTVMWDGELSGFGVISDVTDRVFIEEKLHRTIQQLEEKEKSKTRFLAAAGHDLRQPVTAATLFVYALKFTSPTEPQRDLLDQLDLSMKTFADLLDRLLDISKFDAGVIKPKLASFNLSELFTWLEQNFAQSALDKRICFRFFFPMKKALIVHTDPGLFKAILMNLVSNAIKFTSRGGILVSARLRRNKVILQVWDTGIGIDKKNLSLIFEEFYQVANEQRSREAGLGLGLSICQRAATLLDSQITCRSRLGRGSVFTLAVPLASQGIPSKPTSLDSSPHALSNKIALQEKRIMVVEDDTLVASGLTHLLSGLGAVVRYFNNADHALRHENLAEIDYFIVDYALGGELSGLNFLVSVQQRLHKPINAIVITGETSSQFMNSIVDSPWPVLHKPLRVDHLIELLYEQTKMNNSASSPLEVEGISND